MNLDTVKRRYLNLTNSKQEIEVFEIRDIIFSNRDPKVFLIYEKQFQLKFKKNIFG